MAIKNLDVLEKFIKLPEGKKISDLIADEKEHELELNTDLKVFDSQEDYNTLMENKKKEFETSGREKLLKSMRDESELSYEGVKDPKKYTEALTAKVTAAALEGAKVEPNKKIEELETSLTGLRGTITKQEEKITGLNSSIAKSETASSIDKLISGTLPVKTLIPKDEVVYLIGKKVDLRIEEGKMLLFQNGVVVKDHLENPVDPTEHLKELAAVYAVAPSGGNGGGDEGGGSKSNYASFVKEMTANGINEGGEAFQKEAMKREEAGTLVM